MRLFAAITPPQHVVEDLDAFLEARRDAGSGLRWVPQSQWHLTLAFCAAFPEPRLEDLDERLTRAARRRQVVTVRLRGGGAFPNVGRAKVLWLGLDGADVEADRMAVGARAAISKAGGAVDGRRFRAHLTLARVAHPFEATRWVRILDGYAGPDWTIDSINLIASHLGEAERGRPRYEVLGTYPLGQQGDK